MGSPEAHLFGTSILYIFNATNIGWNVQFVFSSGSLQFVGYLINMAWDFGTESVITMGKKYSYFDKPLHCLCTTEQQIYRASILFVNSCYLNHNSNMAVTKDTTTLQAVYDSQHVLYPYKLNVDRWMDEWIDVYINLSGYISIYLSSVITKIY